MYTPIWRGASSPGEEGPGRAGRAGQGRRDDHGATTPATVTANDAKKVMRLVDKLEELEDLQNVYHTMDITEEIAAASGRVNVQDILCERKASDREAFFALDPCVGRAVLEEAPMGKSLVEYEHPCGSMSTNKCLNG